MPSVKIKDLNEGSLPARRLKIYEIGNDLEIPINRVSGDRGNYYAIIASEKMELMLSEDSKKLFRDNNYQLFDPPEANALRSVFIKEVDKQIDDYQTEQVKENIEIHNEGLKVEEVTQLPTTSKILKIKFKTISMAETVAARGLRILNQCIPPHRIEKEIFVRISHCYNCFSIEHFTNMCPKERSTICSRCGMEGHIKPNCKENTMKCINCQRSDHETTAAKCPIKKEKIKNKTKEIRKNAAVRERSLSRPRAPWTPYSSYAAAAHGATNEATYSGPKLNQQQNTSMGNMPPNVNIIITTAMLWASWLDQTWPGTFQENVDKFYIENGLQPVKFPNVKRPTVSGMGVTMPPSTPITPAANIALDEAVQAMDTGDSNRRRQRSEEKEEDIEDNIGQQIRKQRVINTQWDLPQPIRGDPRKNDRSEIPQGSMRSQAPTAELVTEPAPEFEENEEESPLIINEDRTSTDSVSSKTIASWKVEIRYPESWKKNKNDIMNKYVENSEYVEAKNTKGVVSEKTLRSEITINYKRKQLKLNDLTFVPVYNEYERKYNTKPRERGKPAWNR